MSNSLWDNAMVRDAKKRMTTEEIEQYKKIGEQFYKDMEFQQENNIEKRQQILNDLTNLQSYIANFYETVKKIFDDDTKRGFCQ